VTNAEPSEDNSISAENVAVIIVMEKPALMPRKPATNLSFNTPNIRVYPAVVWIIFSCDLGLKERFLLMI